MFTWKATPSGVAIRATSAELSTGEPPGMEVAHPHPTQTCGGAIAGWQVCILGFLMEPQLGFVQQSNSYFACIWRWVPNARCQLAFSAVATSATCAGLSTGKPSLIIVPPSSITYSAVMPRLASSSAMCLAPSSPPTSSSWPKARRIVLSGVKLQQQQCLLLCSIPCPAEDSQVAST